MVELFQKGGPFMWPLLFALVLGVAVALERLWTLSRASIDTKKFFAAVQEALETGGADKAAEVCANTRGPVASVFHAGLLRGELPIEFGQSSRILLHSLAYYILGMVDSRRYPP